MAQKRPSLKTNLITAESAANASDASDDDDAAAADDDNDDDDDDDDDDNNSDGKDVVGMYVDVNTFMYILHKTFKHVPTCIYNHTCVNVIIFRNVLSLLRRTCDSKRVP